MVFIYQISITHVVKVPDKGPRSYLDSFSNVLTGFMELAETYVKCMNEGGVPCISTAVELLKNNECQRALESALAVFEQKMKEQLESRVPVENDIIEEIQIAAHQAAMDTYKRGALFDKEGKYITKLMVNCTMILCELTVPFTFPFVCTVRVQCCCMFHLISEYLSTSKICLPILFLTDTSPIF